MQCFWLMSSLQQRLYSATHQLSAPSQSSACSLSIPQSLIRLLSQEHLKLQEGERLKAVLTVPACFTHLQRQAIMDAAAIAGVEILQLLNEPTAAAVLYAADDFETSGSPSQRPCSMCNGAGTHVALRTQEINPR